MSKRKQPRKQGSAGRSRKPRFELRLDEALYTQVKSISEEADISMNQLIEGVLRWAMPMAHAGELRVDDDVEASRIPYRKGQSVPVQGCVWFGVAPWVDDDGPNDGRFLFQLDYSGRSAVKSVPVYPDNP